MIKSKTDKQIESFLNKTKQRTGHQRKEKYIQKDITDWLKNNIPEPKEIRKCHGSPYQKAGFPDLEMFWNGTTWSFEIKKLGENSTPLQRERILKLRKTGNHAWVIRSIDDIKRCMIHHINQLGGCSHTCDGLENTLGNE